MESAQLFCRSEKSQKRQEEIDNVDIQRHRSPNVFVIGVALDQIVGIVNDVPAEYECSQAPVDHHGDLTQRKEYLKWETK